MSDCKPIISIVIPIYNTEKYLSKCMESILNQLEKRIEVILVDDGSTDTSPLICDRYASEYTFIRVIHEINAGPATAKNKGYKLAQGRYIFYIDSDDELRSDMFSRMLECAERTNADVVCCSYLQIDETGCR